MEPKAFTLNKGDLKKITQQIMADHKEAKQNNQSEIIVEDIGSQSNDNSSETEKAHIEINDESQDNLETESEAASVKKVTSNPQGPSSAEPNPNIPMTPKKALQMFNDLLTDYEQSEMLNKTIYFIGPKAEKVKGSVMNDHNFGYDDEKGDYKIIFKDHIDYRYECIKLLGQGSFGQVVECYDHKTNTKVALKIIRNRKKFHDQAKVEVKVLEALRDNDPSDQKNIIQIIDHFVFRNHICITTELLSINLYELIKDMNFEGFPMETVRNYAIQILHGLKYMKGLSVIHCDLKPENILLKDKTNKVLKIIDFGSSWFESDRIYTYIQSRFYRAPEIILGIPYTNSIDMWSFACIIIELFIGFPIFPGESENDQLARIMEYKGIPPINVMEESTRSGYFFSDNLDPLPVKNSRGGIRKPCTKSLTQLLDCKNKHFIRFLDSCLHWDPELRLTPEEALWHEWINEGFFAAHPIYLQHRILNSQYQSSVDIDGRKMIKNHEFDEILKLNTKETKTSNQYRSVNSRDIESKNDKRKSVSEFLEFLSKDHFNKTNRLNRDKTEYRVYNQLWPDDDEIIKLEEQMYNLDKPKKPDSSKRKSTKKHGNLIDYWNLTGFLSNDIHRASSKKKSRKSKPINISKLIPKIRRSKRYSKNRTVKPRFDQSN